MPVYAFGKAHALLIVVTSSLLLLVYKSPKRFSNRSLPWRRIDAKAFLKLRVSRGISREYHIRKISCEFKGFFNHLCHDCRRDTDRDVSTAYCRSSSVLQLFNNRRKLRRTKNIEKKAYFILAQGAQESQRVKTLTWKKNRSKKTQKKYILWC